MRRDAPPRLPRQPPAHGGDADRELEAAARDGAAARRLTPPKDRLTQRRGAAEERPWSPRRRRVSARDRFRSAGDDGVVGDAAALAAPVAARQRRVLAERAGAL